MNRKIICNYMVYTFAFSYLCWGGVLALTRLISMKITHPICMILYLAGSFGPFLGSYYVKKGEGEIIGKKDFIIKIFQFKNSLKLYFLVVILVVLYFLYPLITENISQGIPVYAAILLMPLMLFGGGMEETGWRWILQPELEKKFPFYISVMITATVWACWHIPLFFIKGSSQEQTKFIPFYILLIGMSFAQACLYELSKNIWLSILLHCAYNAFQMSFVVEESIKNSIWMMCLMIVGVMMIRNRWYIKNIVLSNTK